MQLYSACSTCHFLTKHFIFWAPRPNRQVPWYPSIIISAEGAARAVHTVHQGMCVRLHSWGLDAHVALHATTSLRFKAWDSVLQHGTQPRMLEGCSVPGAHSARAAPSLGIRLRSVTKGAEGGGGAQTCNVNIICCEPSIKGRSQLYIMNSGMELSVEDTTHWTKG